MTGREDMPVPDMSYFREQMDKMSDSGFNKFSGMVRREFIRRKIGYLPWDELKKLVTEVKLEEDQRGSNNSTSEG